jgi:hypothetical protein
MSLIGALRTRAKSAGTDRRKSNFDAIADLRLKGVLPEDIADALFILGANAVVELLAAELTAQLLEEMAEELRAPRGPARTPWGGVS